MVVVVAVLLAVAFAAGGNAGIAVGVLAGVALVAFLVVMLVSQKRTGLSITPEWAPKESPVSGDDDDDDDDDDSSPAPVAAEPAEPVRALDGQMLGSALAALGQIVDDKLAKSYALGTLSFGSDAVVWTPTTVSAGHGAAELSAGPASIAAIERAPLWGSWALLRIELAVGGAWVFRIPSSVDLAPVLSEIGVTFRQLTAEG